MRSDLAELFHGAEVEGEGVDGGFELGFGVAGDFGWRFVSADVEVASIFLLGAPAVDFHFDFAGQLTGEVFDVDAGATVDVGWVLAGHQAYTHDFLVSRGDCSRGGTQVLARPGEPGVVAVSEDRSRYLRDDNKCFLAAGRGCRLRGDAGPLRRRRSFDRAALRSG